MYLGCWCRTLTEVLLVIFGKELEIALRQDLSAKATLSGAS